MASSSTAPASAAPLVPAVHVAGLAFRNPVVLASGLLFGGVFLSVVASTTAMVKHNLPPSQWARGIGLFTSLFAVGQVIGPAITGLISDSKAGLAGGLMFSGAALLLGALIAIRQRALVH